MNDTAKKGTCGCGRSPTGDCIGWHALSTSEYLKKLQEHERQRQVAEAKQKRDALKEQNDQAQD